VHLHGNASIYEMFLIRALTDGKALFKLSILFTLTFFTLIWLSTDICQELVILLVFSSFKRVSLSFNRIRAGR